VTLISAVSAKELASSGLAVATGTVGKTGAGAYAGFSTDPARGWL